MKQKVIVVVVAVLVIVAGLVVVKKKQRALAALPPPQVPVPAVQTAGVTEGVLETTIHYLGSIAPYTKADLSARISGSIVRLDKREGDRVREGELLVALDDRELTQRAAAAQSELLSARQRVAGARSANETQQAVYERDIVLARAGAISEEALERSRAARDTARSAVDALEESIKGLEMNSAAAQSQLGYAHLTGPFDGVITRRWSEPGDMAVPGKPILTIESTSRYKVLAQVPPEDAGKIAAGSVVYLGNGGQVVTGTVHQVYPALGPNVLATVEVLTDAAPFGLPSGATVGFDVVTGKTAGLVVPDNAVVRTGNGTFAYQVQNGTIHIVAVQSLGAGAGKVAIAGPLKAGDQVAVGQENKLMSLAEGGAVHSPEAAR